MKESGYGTVSTSSVANVPYGTKLTSSSNTVTINGTTVTATPATATAQYTYKFTGWTNGTETVTGNLTVTANFERTTRTYTVSITVNNSSYGNVSQTSVANVPYGTVITSSGTTVTINGTKVTATKATDDAQYIYQFTGWTNGTATVTGATTVTANFSAELNYYTVTFNANGGSGSKSIEVAYGYYAIPDGSTFTEITKDDLFYGNNITPYGFNTTTYATDKLSYIVVTGPTTLYAVWKYKVGIVIEGGEYNYSVIDDCGWTWKDEGSINSPTYLYTEVVQYNAISIFPSLSYSDTWGTWDSADYEETLMMAHTGLEISSHIYLHPLFQKEVVLDLGGGTAPTNLNAWNVSSGALTKIMKLGETLSLPGEPTKTGYRFDGWYYNGTKYTDGMEFYGTATAKWVEQVTVNLIISSPSKAPDSTDNLGVWTLTTINGKNAYTATQDKGTTITTLPTPVWSTNILSVDTSYRFEGWYTKEQDITATQLSSVTFDSSGTKGYADRNTSLYAVTINTGDVELNETGWTQVASGHLYYKWVANNTSVALPTLSVTNRIFDGWFKSDGTQVSDKPTITGPLSITAQFTTQATITVVIDSLTLVRIKESNGTIDSGSYTCTSEGYYSRTINFGDTFATLPSWANEIYELRHFLSTDHVGDRITNSTVCDTSFGKTIRLFAQGISLGTGARVTFIFHQPNVPEESGDKSASANVLYGHRISETIWPTVATVEGWRFMGWYTQQNGLGEKITEGTKLTTDLPTTFHGYWKQEFTITYNVYKDNVKDSSLSGTKVMLEGDTYTWTTFVSSAPSGYTYSSGGSGTADDNKEVNIYFITKKLTLTVRYLDWDTDREIQSDKTYNLTEGTRVYPSDYEDSIDGYSHYSNSPSSSFTITEDKTIIIYYKELAEESWTINWYINGSYYDSDSGTATVGTWINFKSYLPSGYELDQSTSGGYVASGGSSWDVDIKAEAGKVTITIMYVTSSGTRVGETLNVSAGTTFGAALGSVDMYYYDEGLLNSVGENDTVDSDVTIYYNIG